MFCLLLKEKTLIYPVFGVVIIIEYLQYFKIKIRFYNIKWLEYSWKGKKQSLLVLDRGNPHAPKPSLLLPQVHCCLLFRLSVKAWPFSLQQWGAYSIFSSDHLVWHLPLFLQIIYKALSSQRINKQTNKLFEGDYI